MNFDASIHLVLVAVNTGGMFPLGGEGLVFFRAVLFMPSHEGGSPGHDVVRAFDAQEEDVVDSLEGEVGYVGLVLRVDGV